MNYINTPFNYTGSKFKLLSQILPLFDYEKNTFVDVFAGGGSVYTNVLCNYPLIIMNDIISDLVKIHQLLIHDNDFVTRVKEIVPNKTNKEYYHELRNSYNKEKTPEKLYALMLSCTNNMMRFNQKFDFNQTFGERSFSDSTEKKIIEWKNHVKNYQDIIIYNSSDFEYLIDNEFISNINKYCELLFDVTFNSQTHFIKNTMFYIDPPYSETEAGYNAYWTKDSDKRLYEFITKINECGGSFMLSGVKGKHKNGKESWLIQQLISDGFVVKELDCNYEKVARIKNSKESIEVVIMNYDKKSKEKLKWTDEYDMVLKDFHFGK